MLQEWTDKLVAHLRGLEDAVCPECMGDGMSSYDCICHGGGMATNECSPCMHCAEERHDDHGELRGYRGTGTIPHPHKAALRVVARLCLFVPRPPKAHDEDCVYCGGTDYVPRDVSWLEGPQFEPMLRGYYESIARACGRGLATHKGTGGTWTAVSGLAGHVPSLVSSQTLVKAEGATEAEAMQSCLSRALMEE